MHFREVYDKRYIKRFVFNHTLLSYLFSLFVCLPGCTLAIQQREADKHIIKAQIHSQNRQHREALHRYQKAWKTYYETAKELQIRAKILYNMGNLYYDLQEYENALKYYKLSLESSRTLDKEHQIKIFNNIGVIYRYLGRYQDALGYFQEALKVLEQANMAKTYAFGKEYFIIHLNRTIALVKSGNIQNALEILEDLSILENDKKYGYEIALTQTIKGIIQTTYFENLQEALENYQHALTVFEEFDQKYDLAFSYHNIGLLYAQQKQYHEAITYYNKSLELSENIGDQETAWLAYYNLGNLYRDQSDFTQAIHHYRHSIRIIESIRSKLKIDDFKTSFIEDKIDVYKAIINLLLEIREEEEAFNYLERAKSRALVDLLSNQRIQAKEGMDEKLFKGTEQIDDRIRGLLEQLDKEYAKPQGKRTRVPHLTRKLRQERQQYQQLLQEIQTSTPEYASLISVNPLTLGEIQNLIPERTAFLEYFILEDKMFIFVLTRNEFKVEEVEVSQKRLQGTVLAFRIDIEKEMPKWQEKSRWLYSKLVYPAEKHLRDIDTLCIIPYGILHYLPFGALIVNEGKELQTEPDLNRQILLERYDLFYAPSSTVLKFTFDKGDSSPLALLEQNNDQPLLLIFANPDRNLEFAKVEAQGIRELYPQSTLFVESEATEEKVKNFVGNYRLIHFATHGLLDPIQPLFSSLVFADGFLEVHEIFNEIHLASNSLVTLSACNTALGKRTEGDEIIGLTRAFIYAGAPSIVASLWVVDDQSTALLMQRFYRNLNKASKAKALKQAQMSLFHDPEEPVFHHPYYWAAFELIGDYR